MEGRKRKRGVEVRVEVFISDTIHCYLLAMQRKMCIKSRLQTEEKCASEKLWNCFSFGNGFQYFQSRTSLWLEVSKLTEQLFFNSRLSISKHQFLFIIL